MKAALILGGIISDHSFIGKQLSDAEITVVADGGAVHARKMGIVPDMLVGDFDSCPDEDIDFYRRKGTEIIRYPSVKDKTDSEIAADYIIDNLPGATICPGFMDSGRKSIPDVINADKTCKVVIAGALGGRYDHALANIFLLKKFVRHGIEAEIISEECEMTLIKGPCERKFNKGRFSMITILPFTPGASGITAVNVKYPLNNATMTIPTTRGVSNEFAPGSAEACIGVVNGELLVILN